jgi:hypothetical protein
LSAPPDPEDPAYQHLERLVNFGVHGALFAALNSGLWVLQGLRHPFPQLAWFTGAWGLLLLLHLFYVLRLRPAKTG